MPYLGNTPTQQAFSPATDYFSGNGSTTAFTLSRPVASVNQVEVVVENVVQNPATAYTVSGNTITFDGAPPSGTNNIYVRYTSPITQVIQPGQNTVGTSQLQSGLAFSQWSTSGSDISYTVGNVGIGTSSPLARLQTNSTDGTIAIFRTTSGANNTRLNIDVSDAAATAGFAVGGNSSFPALTFANGGSERMRIASNGALGFSGANYGTSGQVLTSNGSGSAPSWQTAGGGITTTTGSAPYYGARAWVLFNSSSGPVLSSVNVSSVSINGTGGTVNFSTAMPDNNYAVVTGTTDDSAWNNGSNVQGPMSNRTTSWCVVTAFARTGGGVGPSGFSVVVYR